MNEKQNSDSYPTIIKTKKKLEISNETILFQGEVTFFIRTFFFVFLGMLVGVDDVKMLIVGIVLGFVLLAARIIPTYVSSMKTDTTLDEQKFILTMAPRGLAAAVLAQMPLFYEIPNAEIFSGLVFVIILTSILITIAGVLTQSKPNNAKTNNKNNITNQTK